MIKEQLKICQGSEWMYKSLILQSFLAFEQNWWLYAYVCDMNNYSNSL